jgi:hypothetical protein
LARGRWGPALWVILFAVAAASCGGGVSIAVRALGRSSLATPTPTPISDPYEIITQSLGQLQDVQTLHLEGELDGSVNVGALPGLPGGPLIGLLGKVKVDNSTISGDVNFVYRAAHISASVPNLLGLTLDYIAVDGELYTKVSLSGDKYSKTPLSGTLPEAFLDPSASLDMVGAASMLRATMSQAGVTAVRVGRDKVDGRDAHHVVVFIPKEAADKAIGSALGSAAAGITIDSLSVDYWAYVDSLQPARLTVKASSASLGDLTMSVTMTRYNQPVTIAPPPNDQVKTG